MALTGSVCLAFDAWMWSPRIYRKGTVHFSGVRGDTVMEALIIQLISGAVGGNAAGALFKNLSLGTIGNSIAGVAGGGIGGQILSAVLPSLAGGMVGQAAGGGIGGLVLMAVVGFIKNKMAS
jgi:uncharacterized membrane protein YeaQ/YmgE (transglycosylase-associated protein family)